MHCFISSLIHGWSISEWRVSEHDRITDMMNKWKYRATDECRVSERDRPWVTDMMSGDYQSMLSCGCQTMNEWRVSERDQSLVSDDGWVENIGAWSAVGYRRWLSGEYRSVISNGLSTWWTWKSIGAWLEVSFRRRMSEKYRSVISRGLPTWWGRLSEHGQSWMSDHEWVESIGTWSVVGFRRWLGGEYRSVASRWLPMMIVP
jgi:hypothetical protein